MHYLTSIFLTFLEFLIFIIVGNFTLPGYVTLGRRITTTDAESNLTQFAYDSLGRLIAVTDALGAVTRYAYDQRGLQNRLDRCPQPRQHLRIRPDGLPHLGGLISS